MKYTLLEMTQDIHGKGTMAASVGEAEKHLQR